MIFYTIDLLDKYEYYGGPILYGIIPKTLKKCLILMMETG